MTKASRTTGVGVENRVIAEANARVNARAFFQQLRGEKRTTANRDYSPGNSKQR